MFVWLLYGLGFWLGGFFFGYFGFGSNLILGFGVGVGMDFFMFIDNGYGYNVGFEWFKKVCYFMIVLFKFVFLVL